MDATSATSSAASSVDGRSVSTGGGGAAEYLNLGMFSSGSSGQSELLGGNDGGFSLGNGFNENSAGTSFDLSDFPSLGGGNNAAAASAGNGLAAALRQRQLLAQQQEMLQGGNAANKSNNLYRLAMTGSNGNFNMASEDFPALSSGAPQPSNGPTNATGLGSSSLLQGSQNPVSISRTSSAGSGMYSNEMDSASGGPQLDGAPGLLGGAGFGGLGGLRGLQQQPQSGGNPTSMQQQQRTSAGTIGNTPSSGSAAGSALNGDFGLLGLLGVIRMTDADRNALALGSDLTLMGLNLGSTEQIYGTFSGPWSDGATSKEPHYQVRHWS